MEINIGDIVIIQENHTPDCPYPDFNDRKGKVLDISFNKMKFLIQVDDFPVPLFFFIDEIKSRVATQK